MGPNDSGSLAERTPFRRSVPSAAGVRVGPTCDFLLPERTAMHLDLEVAESDVVVVYHQPGEGACSMSGKEKAKGYVVTIIGWPAKGAFLSLKSIDHLLNLSFSNAKRPGAGRQAESVKNGEKQHA